MGTRRVTARLASITTLVALAHEGADQRDWYIQARALVETIADTTGHPVRDVAVLFAATSPQTSVLENIRLTLAVCHALVPDGTGREVATGALDRIPMLPGNVRAIRRYYALVPPRPTTTAEEYWDARATYALGPKTGPFARAVAGDDDALVLDTWMFRALSRGHKGTLKPGRTPDDPAALAWAEGTTDDPDASPWYVEPVAWALPPTDTNTTGRIAGWMRPDSTNRREAERRILAARDRLGWTTVQTQAAIWAGIMRRYGRRTGIDLLDTARRGGVPLD